MDNQKKNKDNLNEEKLFSKEMYPDGDPAVINPEELASFPKQKKTKNPNIDAEKENHSVSQKTSPVRSGRNITQTGPGPDKDGFL